MQKHILLIGTYPPPFGGVSSHIKYLSDYLASQGYQVSVISSGRANKNDQLNSQVSVFRINKNEKIASLLAHPFSALNFFSKARKLGVGFKEALQVAATAQIAKGIAAKNQIDLISTYALFYDGLMGALLNETLGIPLVVTAFGEIYNHPEKYKKNAGIVKYILAHASRALSSSNYCAKCYEVLGITQQVDVVYYGIDVNHFSSGAGKVQKIKEKLGINEEPVLLFVARMSKQMGLDVLLGAIPVVLAKNSNTKFIIVGGKEELYEQAMAVAKQYPKNVFVFPNVPFEELGGYYALATAGLVPTAALRPSMGMAIKEAFAAGKPVIASKSGGIPEAITDGVNGLLVPPHDSNILAEAIVKLINDKNAIAAMGQANRERAKQLFDKEMTNQKIHSIFKEVMSKN